MERLSRYENLTDQSQNDHINPYTQPDER